MRRIGMIALIASAAACQPDATREVAERLYPEDGRKSAAVKPGTVLMQRTTDGAPKVVMDSRDMTPAEIEAFLEREKKAQ